MLFKIVNCCILFLAVSIGLVGLLGCSQTTNLVPLSESVQDFNYRNVHADGLKMPISHRKFYVMKVPEGKTMKICNSVFPKGAILPYYLIPDDNRLRVSNGAYSQYFSKEKYALVNLKVLDGKLLLNNSSVPEQTRVVFDRRNLPYKDSSKGKFVFSREINGKRKCVPIVKFGKDSYSCFMFNKKVYFNGENPLTGVLPILFLQDGAIPIEEERTFHGKVLTKFSLQGFQYLAVPGVLVDLKIDASEIRKPCDVGDPMDIVLPIN